MKIWQTFSSEHSAKVKIIGRFDTVEATRDAAGLFNRLRGIQENSDGRDASDLWTELAEACRQSDLTDFTPADAPQLKLFQAIYPAGTEIRIETGATEIQALLKVLIRYGARIEIVTRARDDG